MKNHQIQATKQPRQLKNTLELMLQYFKKIFRFGIFDRFGWFHFEIFKKDRFTF